MDHYPRRQTDLGSTEATLWNWARNSPLAAVDDVAAPTTEDDLRSLLAAGGGRVRAVGSRMSPGRMLQPAAPGDTVLDVSGLRGPVEIGDGVATFAGGTPLADVYAALRAVGRMLPSSPGVIASQTLAGALATGTHGQGLGQGSLADAATSIRLVLADGSVLDVDRDHPWFPAVQLGLGSLGVVTQVALRTTPLEVYTCLKSAVPADGLEEGLEEWTTQFPLSKAWWFPDEDKVHVWAAREATSDEVAGYRANGEQPVEHHGSSDAMNDTVAATLAHMRADTRIVDEDGKPFRTVTRFRDFTDVTGDVYQLFCRGIATPQINIEIGVPMARAAAVVKRIRDWHTEVRGHMHYPVILRCTGASGAWLSPSSGEPTCWFGFVVYYAEDGSLSAEGLSFLTEVEKLLATEGGRPHWGKYFDAGLYDWPALYPHWDAFRAVRDALDPGRRFDNRFTATLFS